MCAHPAPSPRPREPARSSCSRLGCTSRLIQDRRSARGRRAAPRSPEDRDDTDTRTRSPRSPPRRGAPSSCRAPGLAHAPSGRLGHPEGTVSGGSRRRSAPLANPLPQGWPGFFSPPPEAWDSARGRPPQRGGRPLVGRPCPLGPRTHCRMTCDPWGRSRNSSSTSSLRIRMQPRLTSPPTPSGSLVPWIP